MLLHEYKQECSRCLTLNGNQFIIPWSIVYNSVWPHNRKDLEPFGEDVEEVRQDIT